MRNLVLRLLFLLAVVGAVSLFAIQNSSRTVTLGFDLYVAAWRLAEPVPVPLLMGIALGLGLVLGLAVALRWRATLMHRVRALEQELAMSGGGTPDDARSWR